jgi:hypothetical protein
MSRIPQPDKPGIYYYQARGERAPVKVLVFRRNGDLYLSLRREGHPLMMREADWEANWFDDPSNERLVSKETADPSQVQSGLGRVPPFAELGVHPRLFVEGASSP